MTLPASTCIHHPCRRRAQEIEPGYCEPTYWIGMTTLNMGDPLAGLSTMKASLSCKYTAAEALQALNKVYVMMMEAGKHADVGPMLVREGGAMLLCGGAKEASTCPHFYQLELACLPDIGGWGMLSPWSMTLI